MNYKRLTILLCLLGSAAAFGQSGGRQEPSRPGRTIGSCERELEEIKKIKKIHEEGKIDNRPLTNLDRAVFSMEEELKDCAIACGKPCNPDGSGFIIPHKQPVDVCESLIDVVKQSDIFLKKLSAKPRTKPIQEAITQTTENRTKAIKYCQSICPSLNCGHELPLNDNTPYDNSQKNAPPPEPPEERRTTKDNRGNRQPSRPAVPPNGDPISADDDSDDDSDNND